MADAIPIEDEEPLQGVVNIPEEAHNNPEVLNKQFARIPGDISYVSGQYSEAADAVERAKVTLQELDASLLLHYTELGGSAQLVRARVVDDMRRRLAASKLVEAKHRKVKLQGWLKALEGKRDALITIGANLRAELGTTTFGINKEPVSDRVRRLEKKLRR
jgi:hypothetical protein